MRSITIVGLALAASVQIASGESSGWRAVAVPGLSGTLNKLAMLNDEVGWLLVGKSEIFKTRDGGANWQPLTPNFTSEDVRLSAVFFVEENIGWAVGDVGGNPSVWASSDGGKNWLIQQSWVRQKDGPPSALLDVQFVDKEHGMAVGFNGSKAIILATRDGGTNWDLQYSGSEIVGQFSRIEFKDTLHAWSLSQSAVMETADGGINWNLRKFGSSLLNDIQSLDSKYGTWVAGAWGFLYHTTNSVAWSKVSLGKSFDEHYVGFVKFVTGERGWASGTKCDIVTTRDAGKSWTPEECPLSLDVRGEVSTGQMVKSGSKLFIVANPGYLLIRSVE